MNEDITVMVVDDDDDMRALLTRWIGREYKVISAADGNEALSLLKDEKPYIILLDYMMPQMSGTDTLTAIRNDDGNAGIPVFFLTGDDSADAKSDAERLNANGVIHKSLGKKGIIAAIKEALGQ